MIITIIISIIIIIVIIIIIIIMWHSDSITHAITIIFLFCF